MYVVLRKYILFLALSSYGFSALAQIQKFKAQQITTFLDTLRTEEFMGAILVAHDNNIIETRAYGLASLEYEYKNDIDTKFNIASITKMITAVAIMQLVEKGNVDLHVPVGAYLPDYPNQKVRDSVTIHQLLTHTSGNTNFYVGDFLDTKMLQYQKLSDFLPLFANDPLLTSPGSSYEYSASGFVILGLIIEKVSGTNYYDYINKYIFGPARMKNATELEIDAVVEKKASGYTTMFGKLNAPRRNDYFLSKASPAGFHYATVEDLFLFMRSLRDGTLLETKTWDLMIKPHVRGYYTHVGYGISVDQRYNQTILGHSGGWYGIQCELLFFKKDNFTVVILSNRDTDEKRGTTMVANFFKQLIADKKLPE